LFGRLALLLLVVILTSQAIAVYLFRQDRAALLERQFGDTTVVQLKALQTALAASDPAHQRSTLEQLGQAYQVRLVPDEERPFSIAPRSNSVMQDLEERLREDLGPDTQVRIQPRLGLVWIKLATGVGDYWAGFTLQRPRDDGPPRALVWSVILLLPLLISAFLFARYLARPLRVLSEAVARVGKGQQPSPLPEQGPSEIAVVNHGFNQMVANLRQIEDDRAILLAGVSHDLRTPLARLRLGIEMGTQDEQARNGMIEDIEEMDRIITQFLDFARNEKQMPVEPVDANAEIKALVERYQRAGNDVRFNSAELPRIALRPVAFSRLLANLVDNALRYGSPSVEISSHREPDGARFEIADRGAGIPPEEVERLKRPFTRGNAARGGIPGAGLGLAIVDRIARVHGGKFSLLPRPGGGMIAQVSLPLSS